MQKKPENHYKYYLQKYCFILGFAMKYTIKCKTHCGPMGIEKSHLIQVFAVIETWNLELYSRRKTAAPSFSINDVAPLLRALTGTLPALLLVTSQTMHNLLLAYRRHCHYDVTPLRSHANRTKDSKSDMPECFFSPWALAFTTLYVKTYILSVSLSMHYYYWCLHGMVFYLVSACDFWLCIFISSI